MSASSATRFTVSRPTVKLGVTRLPPNSNFDWRYLCLDVIDCDVSDQCFHRFGVWLDGDRVGTTDGRCEDRIASDVGPHVHEQVPRTKEVQQEGHVRKLVQTAIDVARRSGHAVPDDKLCTFDPLELNILLQPALNLPASEPSDCGERPIARQRVGRDEGKRSDQL
jgi:hypothetical protein